MEIGSLKGRQAILGVVHLAPLPTSPRFGGDANPVRERAFRDAQALLEGGADGFIVENFGDAPFPPAASDPAVVAEMSVIAAELRRRAGATPWIGVNVLRNDAAGALAVAAAAGADFIRVNLHCGVVFSDQGLLEGDAHRTLRRRRALGSSVAIFADVGVKHASPPPGFDLARAARDTYERALADALIVTGEATGAAAATGDVDAVRKAVPEAPLYVGSGVTPDNVAALLALADGVIVGTALKEDAVVTHPVDRARVRALVGRVR